MVVILPLLEHQIDTKLELLLFEFYNTKIYDKKVLIVGHLTTLISLFSGWCENHYIGVYKFDGK